MMAPAGLVVKPLDVGGLMVWAYYNCWYRRWYRSHPVEETLYFLALLTMI
jgi:hypothetical protein